MGGSQITHNDRVLQRLPQPTHIIKREREKPDKQPISRTTEPWSELSQPLGIKTANLGQFQALQMLFEDLSPLLEKTEHFCLYLPNRGKETEEYRTRIHSKWFGPKRSVYGFHGDSLTASPPESRQGVGLSAPAWHTPRP